MDQWRPEQLKACLDEAGAQAPVLLDVREPHEYAHCRIEGSTHIPMAMVPLRFEELDPAAQTVVICHHGMRSMQVAMFLEQRGFSNVINLAGGVAAWARQVDPDMPQY